MFENLREDLRRYGATPWESLKAALLAPGAWATVGYRFSRWALTSDLPRPVNLPLRLASAAVQTGVKILTNMELPPGASIGPGLFIAHSGYVAIGSGAVLGKHCTLTQGVTIGHARGEGRTGVPTIGDRVYLGPGSAAVGPITIGSDALVAVGAAVMKSLPPRAVAIGNPATVISRRGAFDVVTYEGMESDPERLAAMAEVTAGG